MTEPDLFTSYPYVPFKRGSSTSMEAANRIEPAAGTLRARVLEHIRDAGSWGRTDEEISFTLQLNPSTARPRRVELELAGLVKDSGATRKTRSGRAAVVWVSA